MRRFLGTALSVVLLTEALLAPGFGGPCPAVAAQEQDDPLAPLMAGVGRERVPWFLRHQTGVREGAHENGCNAAYVLPVSSAPEAQERAVRDLLARDMHALLIVPGEPETLAPVLEEARAHGVAVISHESPEQTGADFDVEMLDHEAFGRRLMDELASRLRVPRGSYAILTTSLVHPTQSIWADAIVAQQQRRYRNIEFLATFPVGEDRNTAYLTTLDLLQVHRDLIGIICLSSEAAPGVARALREQRTAQPLTVIGTSTPNVSRADLKAGLIQACLLWDPAEAARVQAYLARLVMDGKSDEIHQGMVVPDFGEPVVTGHTVSFNRPLLVSRDNIDEFNF